MISLGERLRQIDELLEQCRRARNAVRNQPLQEACHRYLPLVQAARDEYPEEPLLYFRLGWGYQFCGGTDRSFEWAENAYERALELDAHNEPSYLMLAYLHLTQAQSAVATRYFESKVVPLSEAASDVQERVRIMQDYIDQLPIIMAEADITDAQAVWDRYLEQKPLLSFVEFSARADKYYSSYFLGVEDWHNPLLKVADSLTPPAMCSLFYYNLACEYLNFASVAEYHPDGAFEALQKSYKYSNVASTKDHLALALCYLAEEYTEKAGRDPHRGLKILGEAVQLAQQPEWKEVDLDPIPSSLTSFVSGSPSMLKNRECLYVIEQALEAGLDLSYEAELHWYAGKISLHFGDFQTALAHLRTAYEVRPQEPDLIVDLAQALFHCRQFDQIDHVLKSYPNPDGQVRLLLELASKVKHDDPLKVFAARFDRIDQQMQAVYGLQQAIGETLAEQLGAVAVPPADPENSAGVDEWADKIAAQVTERLQPILGKNEQLVEDIGKKCQADWADLWSVFPG